MDYVTMPAELPSPGFDAAAERFDDECGNQVLAHMRERMFQPLCVAFAPRSNLIELGSDTGTEAARLASERGCTRNRRWSSAGL
jgi:hypothetical protein